MAPEGRESPSPERQSGKQLHDATGSGATKSKGEAKQDWKDQSGSKGTEVRLTSLMLRDTIDRNTDNTRV